MIALAVSILFFYPLLGWVLIVVTLGVVTARIAVGIHYISDIIVGICVGTLVAWGSLPLLLQIIL
jgi:membrane-associated phospholipid phosphatase